MGKQLLEINEDAIYKHIQEEFGKNKKDIEESVKNIQDWLKTQPHLPEYPCPKLIKAFLLINKFSIERCKPKIDMYYTVRNMLPEMFARNPCSPEMAEHSRIAYCVPLPKLAPDNRRVMYCKLSKDHKPEDFVLEKLICQLYSIFEILMRNDLFLGCHFVFDAANIELGHLTRLSPMVLKKTSLVMEKVYANRVTSIHCFNYHSGLEALISLMKSVLPSKIANRFHIHKNTDKLFSSFPKSILPKDIGGDEDSIDDINNLWIKTFSDNKELFDKLGSMRVNESLRPTKLVNDEVLGYYGNFKKLDVD